MDGTAKHPPAGWYEDPDDGALQRFWDGTRWTNSRMPRNEAVPLEGEPLPPAPAPVPIAPAPIGTTRYSSDAPSTADSATGMPPAAWYADPENPEGMRYWDGGRWTEHRTDYLAAPAPKKASDGLIAAGYIFSFLIPVVGVVIGVIVMGRKNNNGRWILALSLLFLFAFVAISEFADPNGN
jgi:hypothetical protein